MLRPDRVEADVRFPIRAQLPLDQMRAFTAGDKKSMIATANHLAPTAPDTREIAIGTHHGTGFDFCDCRP
jgi:hypothetical protein